jgi:hypothetical protein
MYEYAAGTALRRVILADPDAPLAATSSTVTTSIAAHQISDNPIGSCSLRNIPLVADLVSRAPLFNLVNESRKFF